MKPKMLLFLLLFCPLLLQAGEKTRIPYSRLANEVFSPGPGELVYRNAVFYNDLPDEGKEYFVTDSYFPPAVHFIRGGFLRYLASKGIRPGKDGYYHIQKSLEFSQCRFEDDLRFSHCIFESALTMEEVDFPKPSEDAVGIETNQGGALLLDSCVMKHYFNFQNKEGSRLYPRFRSTDFLHFTAVCGEVLMRIKKCRFDLSNFWLQSHHEKTSVEIDSCEFLKKGKETLAGNLTELFINNFSFSHNKLSSSDSSPLVLYCPAKNSQIYRNDFNVNVLLILSSAFVNSEPNISLMENRFRKKLMLGLESIGLASSIDPKALNNLNFGIDWNGYYDASDSLQLSSLQAFRQYQKTNKLLLDFFRSTADLNAANQMYVHIMEAEGRKLLHEYEEAPGFQGFFRYRLNGLLHYYTRYGTDPARAIVISVYVILLFAFFYFFFPSNWDVHSKARLLQDFRDFAEKNEKGYLRPFFRLSKGFTLSMFNAIILSLNAFTTLGFGEIPTTGLARYVCVIQGFIGWFLLSLFTVALLNQAQL